MTLVIDRFLILPVLDRMRHPKKDNAPLSILVGCLIGLVLSGMNVAAHARPAEPAIKVPGIYALPTMEQAASEQGTERRQVPGPAVVDTPKTTEPLVPEKETVADDVLQLFAQCVEAEAEGEGLTGKRLVTDVILNRVDDRDFPGTIEEVILERNSNGIWQFSVAGNGMLEEADPSDETYAAIRMELDERSYPGLLYFTSEGYSKYGTPWRKVGRHYFSTK